MTASGGNHTLRAVGRIAAGTGTGTGAGAGRPRGTGRARVRLAATAGAVVALVALTATGCGIRTTSVPVDAGPAPSRLPCEISGDGPGTQDPAGVPAQVYLLCASGLVPVERAVRIPDGATRDSGPRAAQALLDELQTRPPAAERAAGFTTSVRGPLTVSGPRKGDPSDALRLSVQPEDLPTTALAQIVCTLAASGTVTSPDADVVLGGPGDYPVRGYPCDQRTKSRPDTAAQPRTPGAAPSDPAATPSGPSDSTGSQEHP